MPGFRSTLSCTIAKTMGLLTAEDQRLKRRERRPSLVEILATLHQRTAMGTSRENYSADGDAWNYLTHHQTGWTGLIDILQSRARIRHSERTLGG